MMIKYIFIICITSVIYATSTMFGISHKGYFDFDNKLDTIDCNTSSCSIKTSQKINLFLNIKNNMGCSSLNISQADTVGSIKIECSNYGEKYEYKFIAKKDIKSFVLDTVSYEKAPTSPDDTGKYFEMKCNNFWTIDKGIPFRKKLSELCKPIANNNLSQIQLNELSNKEMLQEEEKIKKMMDSKSYEDWIKKIKKICTKEDELNNQDSNIVYGSMYRMEVNDCLIKYYKQKISNSLKYMKETKNFKITKKGIIDKNNNILNKYITNIPITYMYNIEKDKNYGYALHKETFLHSSKEQCHIPLHKENNSYTIYNIYCYDAEFGTQKESPIFYIYNFDGIDIHKFNPEVLSQKNVTYGTVKKKKIIFKDVNIYSFKDNKYHQSNLDCIIPGKDFFDSKFEDFKCHVQNLKTMMESLKENRLIDKIQYFDLALIQNTIEKFPITSKTLTPYNNIAYYLQKAGANEEAAYLLEKIIEKFPNRTVAYYNLGDAYWTLGKKQKAIKAYTTYIEQMCHKGLQKKIPNVVLNRVKK